MIIFPAIDLREGRCVRLRQGDPSAETVFGDDPAAMAIHWARQGAEWLHVVNLDGALGATQSHITALHRPKSIRVQHPGEDAPAGVDDELQSRLPVNLRRLREIRRAVDIPIQFGGGLRTLEDIQLALGLGADRVVLGTAAVEQPQLVADAIGRWGAKRIVVGIDARDGKVATHGWKQTSKVDAVEIGHQVHALGVRRVVFTDIARDGMLTGVNLSLTTRLADVTGLKVIASGGVSGIGDIERLKAHEYYNIEGVIVGQALYTGGLDLPAAIAVGSGPLQSTSAGIVPFRRTADGFEYLLLYNMFCEQWQFPRGGASYSEVNEQCALHRFEHETGLSAPRVQDDFRVELNYMRVIRDYSVERTIVYFLAETEGDEIRLGSDVHCEARWFPYQDAWELLTETGPEQLPALDVARAYLEGSD
jgi:phosphoribosylformimino-5-aminoimidazole carboxamide ribotide isomerase